MKKKTCPVDVFMDIGPTLMSGPADETDIQRKWREPWIKRSFIRPSARCRHRRRPPECVPTGGGRTGEGEGERGLKRELGDVRVCPSKQRDAPLQKIRHLCLAQVAPYSISVVLITTENSTCSSRLNRSCPSRCNKVCPSRTRNELFVISAPNPSLAEITGQILSSGLFLDTSVTATTRSAHSGFAPPRERQG